ncbi:PCI-domain-containing protein [Flagelloscypha sp. PMI_526]|nr:PCI-domain-containing protein [Flagelloscypha sp. PMI_526]
MSVSIFAEGTFEEQVQDLVNYIVRNKAEEERSAAIQPFQESLRAEYSDEQEKKRKVIKQILDKVSGFGEGNEKEIQGFFNLLFAHLFSSHGPDLATSFPPLLSTIESASSPRPVIKFQILSNLYNALPLDSTYRLQVFSALLRLASAQNNLDILHLAKSDVELWLDQWTASGDEKSKLLEEISCALEFPPAVNISLLDHLAYEFLLLYARRVSPTSPYYQNGAVRLLATTLRTSTIFDFDTLLTINSVVAIKDHPLFSLLQVFLNNGLSELNSWISSHKEVLAQNDISTDVLERKMRLLTLASLGFKNVGQKISYNWKAWVIDVIRSNLLSGKLSQTTETLYSNGNFWSPGLLSWKKSLDSVLDVIATARKQAGNAPPSAPPPPANTDAAPVTA